MYRVQSTQNVFQKTIFRSASVYMLHSWFYFNFEFRVMSFSPTVTLYVWLCYACFPCFLSSFSSQDRSLPESIPFVFHAFSRREIHKNRIFQASLITLRTTFEFSCEFFFVELSPRDSKIYPCDSPTMDITNYERLNGRVTRVHWLN